MNRCGMWFLVEEIVDVVAIVGFARGQHAQPGKFGIPAEALPPHDEGVDERPAEAGNSTRARRNSAAGTSRISDSGVLPRALAREAVPLSMAISPTKSRGPERRGSARVRPVNRRPPDCRRGRRPWIVALAGPVDHFTFLDDAAPAQRLEHGELTVVQLRKGDALGVAVELLVRVQRVHRRVRVSMSSSKTRTPAEMHAINAAACGLRSQLPGPAGGQECPGSVSISPSTSITFTQPVRNGVRTFLSPSHQSKKAFAQNGARVLRPVRMT